MAADHRRSNFDCVCGLSASDARRDGASGADVDLNLCVDQWAGDDGAVIAPAQLEEFCPHPGWDRAAGKSRRPHRLSLYTEQVGLDLLVVIFLRPEIQRDGGKF